MDKTGKMILIGVAVFVALGAMLAIAGDDPQTSSEASNSRPALTCDTSGHQYRGLEIPPRYSRVEGDFYVVYDCTTHRRVWSDYVDPEQYYQDHPEQFTEDQRTKMEGELQELEYDLMELQSRLQFERLRGMHP